MEQNEKIRHTILEGSVLRATFMLVGPILLSHFLETAWHFLNGFWVGRLGPVSFAAINISSFLVWMFYAVIGIMNTGTSSLVAQMDGAGDEEKALEVAHQGLLGTTVLAGIYSLGVILFGHRIFMLMGANMDVVHEAYLYAFLIFLFGIPFGIMENISAILRGYGDTRTPLKALAYGFAITFILDPLLILGMGPFPRLGVAGGAIAANVGFSLSLFIFISLILKKKVRFRLQRKSIRFDPSVVWRIIQIGLPPSVSSITFSIVYIFLTTIISHFGTEAMAAIGIGHRIESLSVMICLGFSMTAVTLVGQNLGAGNRARAEKAAWGSVALISSVTFLISILYYTFSRQFVSLFITDPATMAISISYVQIVSICQVFMGIGIVLDGVFSGSGDTLPAMLINIPVTLLRIPLAYYLAITLSMGINGVWWAITILVIVRGLLSLGWFSLGRWKNTRYVELLRQNA